MKLPGLDQADVPESKLVDYLLSPTHSLGRSKARFFNQFGFTREEWLELAEALMQHAADHGVTEIEETLFGKKYIVDGTLLALDGRVPVIRVVWFVEKDDLIPRFVTAYPIKVEEREGNDEGNT